MVFRCETCGEIHDGIPDYGFQYPDYYVGIPESERESRIMYDGDLCTIDGEAFFVRGVILIPVLDQDCHFGIGAWASQKKENFEIYVKRYDSSEIGPFFGWLSNEMPFFETSTMNLKTMLHFRGKNQRPLIELDNEDHPFCTAFHTGLSTHAVWALLGNADK